MDTESFTTTFGPKAQRKRPTINAGDIEVPIALYVLLYSTIIMRLAPYSKVKLIYRP